MIPRLMIFIGVLGLALQVTVWTRDRPVISQRLVKTVSVGPNMCAGFKTVSLMR